MEIHRLAAEDALRSLGSGPDGLASPEASRRLSEFGPNEIERVRTTSLPRCFLRQFHHFLALLLWAAALFAFLSEWLRPGHGMGTLGIAIVGVIVVNGGFSFWQEYRASAAIAALQKLLPSRVKVVRDGRAALVEAATIVPGDVVVLEEGDRVPADCRLLAATGLRVNKATITGESAPVAGTQEPSREQDLARSRNVLLAGTWVVSGKGRAVVFATGMRTEFGKIARLTQSVGVAISPLQREISHTSRWMALLAISVSLAFFGIGRLSGLPWWENFVFTVGILVANVPEGLLPTVTLALAMASQRMARRNALVRNLASVEALGSTTVICTDKTGTLTENRMAARKVFFDGSLRGAASLAAAGKASRAGRLLLEAAFCCENVAEGGPAGRLQGDPTEVALVEMARSGLPEFSPPPRVDEIPFDSDRKRLSTLHQTSAGLRLYTKGALESILPLCRAVQVGSELVPLDADRRRRLLDIQAAMAGEGLRVLAFAFRLLDAGTDRARLEEELVLTGLVGLEDPPRPEVRDAVRRCREAHIRVIMVTGDHPETARAIARQVGLTESEAPRLVLGESLGGMSAAQLQLVLDSPELIFARVDPEQKMRIVSALISKNERVAVTGDGVNDAPALRAAHVGIAMGETGTDVAREAADVVLLDDNFASIVRAIEEGRSVFENIRKFLTYILTSNIPELVPYLAAALVRIPLPLTVVQILAVDLGTDIFPALALGAESPAADVMERPPRSLRERLLTPPLLARAYLFLGPMEAAAAMVSYFFVLRAGGWHPGMPLASTNSLYLEATTACLTAIILMQVVNVFLCRSDRDSVFSLGFATNSLILWGIILELAILLLIDTTAVGHRTFGTAPIPPAAWLIVVPFALGMLALEELRKALLRRRRRPVS